jgi:3-deoxy-D-manno-octulosonic-acid transferase
MFHVYTIIYIFVLVFLFPFQYLKRPGQLRKKWLREKFGLIGSHDMKRETSGTSSAYKGTIWVHAVSVGEVTASLPLLHVLRKTFPEKGIVLSTVTDTGQQVARTRSPEGTAVVYLPFDIPRILETSLQHTRPELLIVIETELWPNLFRVFKDHGIPILLLNGRISARSFRGYKRISFFMKMVLSFVDFFGMQRAEYRERIQSLGADAHRVRDIGNFKFDSTPPEQLPQWTENLGGPVIVAGSSHEGEEALFTDVYLALKGTFPDLVLVIAPRHPERFHAVETMLRDKGAPYRTRSSLDNGQPGLKKLTGTVVLLDTVGELSAVYGASDIAIIGKSFRGDGGQNPFEAAYWGKPIVCGPHMENFPVILDFYRAGGAREVREEDLSHALSDLLMNPEKATRMGMKAKELYQKNTGAVDRAMEIIRSYLPK